MHFVVWLGLAVAAEVGGVSFDSRTQTLTVGAVKMRVKQGDITKEKADAIINSTNEHVDMTGGSYSSSLTDLCVALNCFARPVHFAAQPGPAWPV